MDKWENTAPVDKVIQRAQPCTSPPELTRLKFNVSGTSFYIRGREREKRLGRWGEGGGRGERRQNDLQKCSTPDRPVVCGTAHQKGECAWKDEKEVGALQPISCCESTIFFCMPGQKKKCLQYLNHIKSVQGSHAYGQGSKAARGGCLEELQNAVSEITISWREICKRGVWWLPPLPVSSSGEEGHWLHGHTTLYYKRNYVQMNFTC